VVWQSPSESPWTEDSGLKRILGDETYTDMAKALKALGDYVKGNSDVFGSVDHVALFTG